MLVVLARAAILSDPLLKGHLGIFLDVDSSLSERLSMGCQPVVRIPNRILGVSGSSEQQGGQCT